MNRYSRGQARRSVFATAGFRLVSQAATLASYVVLVREMTEESFGVLSLLYAIVPVVSTVASFGIEQTLRRFQPEYIARGEHSAAQWLYGIAARLRLLANLLVLGAVLAAWNLLAPVFGLAPFRGAFLLFCVVILLHFQVSLLKVSLASHMRNGLAVALTVALPGVKLAGYSYAAWRGELTLELAILIDAAGYAATWLALRLAHERHRAGDGAGTGVEREPAERRRLGRYALFNNFNDAGTLLLTAKSDNFFVAALLNAVAVGAYSFYTRLNEMVSQWLPIRQLADVIQPLLFAVPKLEAERRLPRYFALLLNTTLAVQLPIAVYAAAFHAEIVAAVFAGKFAEWSWLLPVVVGFATLNRIAEPVTLVAQYQEKAGIILASKVFGLYNAVAILALAPAWGLLGVALATGTAQLMKNGFIWWHVRRTARWDNCGAVLLAYVAVGGGAYWACRAAADALEGGLWLDLACGAAICGFATLVYLRTPALADSDRAILASVFRGREIRVLGWLGVVRPTATRTT
ncbi:MAG: oligosaccharide flippase family protein [Pseudomonadota bacterium]